MVENVRDDVDSPQTYTNIWRMVIQGIGPVNVAGSRNWGYPVISWSTRPREGEIFFWQKVRIPSSTEYGVEGNGMIDDDDDDDVEYVAVGRTDFSFR